MCSNPGMGPVSRCKLQNSQDTEIMLGEFILWYASSKAFTLCMWRHERLCSRLRVCLTLCLLPANLVPGLPRPTTIHIPLGAPNAVSLNSSIPILCSQDTPCHRASSYWKHMAHVGEGLCCSSCVSPPENVTSCFDTCVLLYREGMGKQLKD